MAKKSKREIPWLHPAIKDPLDTKPVNVTTDGKEVVLPNRIKDFKVGDPVYFTFGGYGVGAGKITKTEVIEVYDGYIVTANGYGWIEDGTLASDMSESPTRIIFGLNPEQVEAEIEARQLINRRRDLISRLTRTVEMDWGRFSDDELQEIVARFPVNLPPLWVAPVVDDSPLTKELPEVEEYFWGDDVSATDDPFDWNDDDFIQDVWDGIE